MRGFLIFCLAGAMLLGQTATTTTTKPAPKKAATKSTAAPAKTAAKAATATPAKTASRPATAARAKPAAALPLTTDTQKTIYALGLAMYRSLGQFDLSPEELELVKRAIGDAAANKPAVKLEEWGPKIQGLARERQTAEANKQKAVSQAYLAKCAAAPGAVKTPSGLIYRELRPGTGKSPAATDTVKVNYAGTLIDGTEFDSSYKRNEPATFPLDHVIKCWTEGVQRMKVGGKSELVCPADIAYGDRAQPSIPAGSTLVFTVELLDVTSGPGGK